MRKLGRAVMTGAAALTVLLIGSVTAQQTGSFTDRRDKQTYKTVKIGKQTWMAQNLYYQTKSGSWCYEDKADNCKKYGKLYDWNTANKACPSGWHLPSPLEWRDLAVAVGDVDVQGKSLKAKTGWNWNDEANADGNGTDDYGFSALPGGNRAPDGKFNDIGTFGSWWSTQLGWSLAYNRNIIYGGFGYFGNSNGMKYGYSVRCVADT